MSFIIPEFGVGQSRLLRVKLLNLSARADFFGSGRNNECFCYSKIACRATVDEKINFDPTLTLFTRFNRFETLERRVNQSFMMKRTIVTADDRNTCRTFFPEPKLGIH